MSEVCRIRPVTLDDLPMLLTWRNHPNVRHFMLTQHEISLEEHRAWFQTAIQDRSRRLLIVENKQQPIGYVQFSSINSCGVADWGFYVHPDAHRGTGRKLGVTALNYAFGPMALHKVCGKAIEKNTVSIAFHQRLGFIQEGVLRDQHCIDGEYHNLYCFGLLTSDWLPTSLI